jgi:GDPmannose 4,6-dehydratase
VSAPRRALITGVAGQDGSYLAELLCAEGLEVHGVVRDGGEHDGANLDGVRGALTLHVADLLAPGALRALVESTQPDEIFHLAAPAFVPASWSALAVTMQAIAVLTGELIDAVRAHAPSARVVVAGSREMFGAGAPSPQREDTPCRPSTPYGIAKLAGHQLVGLARARDDLHLSSAILYNHESPRRRPEFVTRRVTRAVAAIALGRQQRLELGDLDAVRDWCAAVDVVRGMRLMAAAAQPDDYVLASGVGRSVRELVAVAFAVVGLDPVDRVEVDPALVRPREPSAAVGDATRARERLGWAPRTSFEELVAEMVAADLTRLSGSTLRDRDL